MASGIKLAALYSFPPCSLGFCGRQDKNAAKILEAFLGGQKISILRVRKILESFEASYPYYKLIARVNKIKDPFDKKVVEAYWIGNKLLENVNFSDLKNLILNDFTRPGLLTKKQAAEKTKLLPKKTLPHHSFHVLFIGSITGKVKFTTKVRDLCRVGCGRITEVKNSKLKVKSSPLITRDKKFFLGKKIEKEIGWNKKFLPKVKVGDWVSFHWGQACQILTKNSKRTFQNIQNILCHS